MPLFPKSYYETCSSVIFGSPSLSEYFGDAPTSLDEESFSVSDLYDEIPNFSITEYELLKDNEPATFDALSVS